jgi:competence protein ComGC
MKRTLRKRQTAFTFIEMCVVIVVLALFVAMLLAAMTRPRGLKASPRSSCLNNLKVIGTAYRIWAGDNGGLVSSQASVTNGGWKELLSKADQGAMCWTNYALMENDLGRWPKLVLCPSDDRNTVAGAFAPPYPAHTAAFGNTTCSYFVGVGANDVYPQSIAGGDRNLGPGAKPDPDYGYSPKNGKGNDVAIPISGPVSWSLKVHSAGYTLGAGNILLGDGSGQQVSTATLNKNWLCNARDSGNWPAGHVPASPSIRLVFP